MVKPLCLESNWHYLRQPPEVLVVLDDVDDEFEVTMGERVEVMQYDGNGNNTEQMYHLKLNSIISLTFQVLFNFMTIKLNFLNRVSSMFSYFFN